MRRYSLSTCILCCALIEFIFDSTLELLDVSVSAYVLSDVHDVKMFYSHKNASTGGVV